MKSHDGCQICKILFKSELVAVQHMLGVKHHKRYECVQKESGKPISHFCPVCGIGNIPDLDLWVVHIRSALHKRNFDQYMQFFYAQKTVLNQSKAKVSKNRQTLLDNKDSKSRDSGDNRLDQSQHPNTADKRRDISAITCSRRATMGTRGGFTSRHHPNSKYPPRPSSFGRSHSSLYVDRTSPTSRLPPPSFYPSGEQFYNRERRTVDRFGSPINRERDEGRRRYFGSPSFDPRLQSRQSDNYPAGPRTSDTRNVYGYRHAYHHSEEPILSSEAEHSRYREGYYRSHPHYHAAQALWYSPYFRRSNIGTHGHNRSHSSTSHSHTNRPSNYHRSRRSSRSNLGSTNRSISQDSSRRLGQVHKDPDIPGRKETIVEEPEPTHQSKDGKGQDKSKLFSEVEDVQLEFESQILDEVEGTGSMADPNPELGRIEAPEIVEKEPEPRQGVQNRNPEGEPEEANEPLDYDPDKLFPPKKNRKKSHERGRKKKGKAPQSADVLQMEQQEEEQSRSTPALFAPSDRQLTFMDRVQKTHEVSIISDEIEKINKHQSKLTYYIRQLKFIRSQNKKEKRQMRRRRSVLLAELNQSDSQAETGPSDNFDDSTPPRIGPEDISEVFTASISEVVASNPSEVVTVNPSEVVASNPSEVVTVNPSEVVTVNPSEVVTVNQTPVAVGRGISTPNPPPVEKVSTAELPLKSDESQQTDSAGRPIIIIDDERDEVVDSGQYLPPSKRTRRGSTAESTEQQPVSTESPKRKRPRKATEPSENVPPADHPKNEPTIPSPLSNTILLQTLGEAPIGSNTSMGNQKQEEPAPNTVADPQVDGGSRVDQRRLRFVRGLLSHPKCKDYTFADLDKLINDYNKSKLSQTKKRKKN